MYGEVVAVLWAAGHVNAALELEGFWNELGREIPFSLYCGYPRESLGGSEHPGAVSAVCRLHTEVIGSPPVSGLDGSGLAADGLGGSGLDGTGLAAAAGRSGAADLVPPDDPLARAHWTDAARTFPGTRESPRAARVLVLEMLAPWRGQQLVADAALVVAELANNAVVHAGSEFGVTLVLSGDVLRISVDDALPLGAPHGSRWLPARPDHGLGVVAAMSDRWGVEPVASGKAVWAELLLPVQPTAYAPPAPPPPARPPPAPPPPAPPTPPAPRTPPLPGCVRDLTISVSPAALIVRSRTRNEPLVTTGAGVSGGIQRPGELPASPAPRQPAVARARSRALVSRRLRPGSSPTGKMMGHSSVTPTSASRLSCFSIPASVPVIARAPGDAAPSRSSSLR